MSKFKSISLFKLILLLGMLNLISCDSSIFHPKLSEGEIEYDVTYPAMEAENVMVEFMPESMTYKFKNNKFITDLSAGMGMFKANFIGDCETHKMTHLVKMVNKKYNTVYDENSIAILNKAYDDFTLIETNSTKTIAGYECKKIWVIFTAVSMPNFELYYTSDISIKDPNWSLPFTGVEGVLMEYEMKRNGIIMKLTATSVKKTDVEDDVFSVPEEYEDVTIEFMEEELDKLFETFNY
ncbi:MAG: hypothetical protein HOB26_07385 [Flavobacteriales bacterium]|nr:hypothetical protein [Flavobacteriales bacterium]MBT6746360.1 hypothetical protein [Flavobacteriales bacterium]